MLAERGEGEKTQEKQELLQEGRFTYGGIIGRRTSLDISAERRLCSELLLTLTTCGVCSRENSGALLLLLGDTQELGGLGGLSRGRGVWQDG